MNRDSRSYLTAEKLLLTVIGPIVVSIKIVIGASQILILIVIGQHHKEIRFLIVIG
jgi:hypothetical protein